MNEERNLNEEAETYQLNLRVLKRKDAHITSILGISKFTVVYEYFIKNESWEKSEVEGTLFVVVRLSHPEYSIYILNRKNPKDFVFAVTPSTSVEESKSFVILSNDDEKVYGFWFGHDSCRKAFITAIRKIAVEEIPSDDDQVEDKAVAMRSNTRRTMIQLVDLIRENFHEDSQLDSFEDYQKIIKDMADDKELLKISYQRYERAHR